MGVDTAAHGQGAPTLHLCNPSDCNMSTSRNAARYGTTGGVVGGCYVGFRLVRNIPSQLCFPLVRTSAARGGRAAGSPDYLLSVPAPAPPPEDDSLTNLV